eukprot:EST45988.1 Hypothetical protein SS50377_13970 [Spironucleus salmonicida]
MTFLNELSLSVFQREQLTIDYTKLPFMSKLPLQYSTQLTVQEKNIKNSTFIKQISTPLSLQQSSQLETLFNDLSIFIQIEAYIKNQLVGPLLLFIQHEMTSLLNLAQINFLLAFQELHNQQLFAFVTYSDPDLVPNLLLQLKSLNIPVLSFTFSTNIYDIIAPFAYYFNSNTIILTNTQLNLSRLLLVNQSTLQSVFNFLILGETLPVPQLSSKLNKNKILVITQQKLAEVQNKILSKSQYFPFLNNQRHLSRFVK